MTLIQRLIPTNLESEKKKFFFDPNYNPQFIYADAASPEELQKYVTVSNKYSGLAEKILSFAEGSKIFEEKAEDKKPIVLAKDEVERKIVEFLEKESIRKTINLRFTERTFARTSIHQNTLTIRLPIQYTDESLDGMLYHEIGTHQLRSMNDRQQIWKGKTGNLKLNPYYVTEEGLAVLHSQIPKTEKLLFFQSVLYLAVLYAVSHTFSETYAMLKKYMKDSVKRFDICMRVKRGMKDTSLHGAFPKDQVYLKGSIEVWKWLQTHNFDPSALYIGKIAVEDVDKLLPLSQAQPLLLPHFYTENPQEYRKQLIKIGETNFFESFS
jgi:hypothetical protein